MNTFLRQLKLVVDDDSSAKMLRLFDHQVRLHAMICCITFHPFLPKNLKYNIPNN